MIFLVVLYLIVMGITNSGGEVIGEDDVIHYLGKNYQYIKAHVGNPSDVQTISSGYRWKYGDVTMCFDRTGCVDSVEIWGGSHTISGCSLSDSHKTVEATMKKLSGSLVSTAADLFYEYNFQYNNQMYKLGCVVEASGEVSILFVSYK